MVTNIQMTLTPAQAMSDAFLVRECKFRKGLCHAEMVTIVLGSVVLFQNGSTQRPDVSIISVERCGAQTFAILRIVNVSKSDHIFFPLSPMYAQGITVHNVGIEVERSGSWVAIQRGLDLQPAGFRDLGPGEQIIDRVGLPLDQQRVFLKPGRMMRVSVPYKHTLSSAYNDVTSPPFKFVSVSAHSSSPPCPAKP